MVHSEPAASTAVSGGMLIADPQTLSQLQALVHQQQAVQGWHNASHLLQALHMQQQLQQTAAGSSVGRWPCTCAFRLACLADDLSAICA